MKLVIDITSNTVPNVETRLTPVNLVSFRLPYS